MAVLQERNDFDMGLMQPCGLQGDEELGFSPLL